MTDVPVSSLAQRRAAEEAALAAREAARGGPGGPRRPTGKGLVAAGLILAFCGLVLLLLGAAMPADELFGGVGGTPYPNGWKPILLWTGAGAVHGGVLLWIGGTIVRALFFLPGREVGAAEVD